jgi:radical SAM superfamily enzyme
MLINPKYGLKNFEVKHLVEKRLEERDAMQGRIFNVIIPL